MENEELEEIDYIVIEDKEITEDELGDYIDYCYENKRDIELEEEYLENIKKTDLQNEIDDL